MDSHSKNAPLGDSVIFNYTDYIKIPNLQSSKKNVDIYCPHSKKMYLCLEARPSDKIAIFMRGHILKCPHCFAKKQKIIEIFQNIKKNIPISPLSDHFKMEINEEVSAWIKQNKLSHKKTYKSHMKEFLSRPSVTKVLKNEWTKYVLVSFMSALLFKYIL